MVNFVLDDLCRPAGEGFDAGLEIFVLPLDLDCLVTLTRTRTAQQGKTPLFCIVWTGKFDDLGVEHRHICTIIIKHNDPLVHTDHIRRHAYTGIFVGN